MIPVDPKPFHTINKSLALTIIFAIIFASAFAFFAYWIYTMRQNIISLTSQNSVLRQEESEASTLKSELVNTDAKSTTLTSYFVDAKDPIPFEETIESYGKKTNTIVTFDGLDVKQNPASLNASFHVEGSFADLYRFFALFESAPYDFSIQNMDIQTSVPAGFVSSGSNQKSDWQARVVMSVYSVKNSQ